MPRPYIRLRGVSPQVQDQCWESDGPLRIGRSQHVEISLADSSISRRHAEVDAGDGGWVLRDTGSTNGTFLNGARVGRAGRWLKRLDLVQCGDVVLVVQELVAEPSAPSDTPDGSLQVQATTEQSWEEAVEHLALGMTRQHRPGDQLLSLLRAGQHLCQSASPDELLAANVRDAVTTLKARRGSIVLADAATSKLAVRALFAPPAEGVAVAAAQGAGRAFSSTLARRCLESGQSLLCNDVRTDPELLRAHSVAGGAMGSVVCALLRTPRNRLGVLHLDRPAAQPPFTPDDLRLADALAAHMATAIEGAQALQEKQRSLFVHTVVVLAQTIELRDEYTGGHTQRVTDYALLLADRLGLSSEERHALRVGAPLHDIGKIGIDDAVLRKQGHLTPQEFELMKTHTVKGGAILGGIPDLEFIIPIVRSHHERWDGQGYPDGLSGRAIPWLARLVAVADTFDAMTTDRPYRVGLTSEEAFAEIDKGIGVQFDPECAAAFLRARPQVEQLLQQNRATSDTRRDLGKLYDVRKLLAGAQPA